MHTKLVLLIVSLPPNPSSLRVRVWRRLRAIGAVALKRTVYLLPDTPDHYEHFQWLAQEVQRAGGEATLLRVEQIENMSSGEIVQLFHEARNSEYHRLGGRYRKLLQTLARKSAADHPPGHAELRPAPSSATSGTTAPSRHSSSGPAFGIVASPDSRRSSTRQTFATASSRATRRAGSIW